MSDFLKKMKGLFVEEVPGTEPQAPPSTRKSAARPPAPGPQRTNIPQSPAGQPGKPADKFRNVLFEAMEKANLDGFDYLEYKQSLRSLAKMNMDEATRFRSAYAMAQTMGATPAGLVGAAEHYIKVLQREEQKFEQALVTQRDTRIKGKRAEGQKLNELIKRKQAQIKQLENEITQHQKQAQQLEQQVNTAAAKVETTKNNFIATYNQVVEQIQADIEKMKRYLK